VRCARLVKRRREALRLHQVPLTQEQMKRARDIARELLSVADYLNARMILDRVAVEMDGGSREEKED